MAKFRAARPDPKVPLSVFLKDIKEWPEQVLNRARADHFRYQSRRS